MKNSAVYNEGSLIRLLAAAAVASALLAQAPPPQPAPAAQQGQLDGSETLFTVLAAINVAGYDADADSTSNSPIRRQIRDVHRIPASELRRRAGQVLLRATASRTPPLS